MYQIYCITNKVNGKQYVGLTKYSMEDRWQSHVSTALHKTKKYAIHHAIAKYGPKNFTLSILESNVEKDFGKDREIYWIKTLNTLTEGYNLTSGGDGTSGRIFTNEHKTALSAQTKLLHEKRMVGMYGKTHTPETIEKMKASSYLKGKTGKDHPSYGRKHTQETINKLKSRVITDEARQNYSAARLKAIQSNPPIGENNGMYGKHHSEEAKQKQSLSARARQRICCVYCNRMISPANYVRWHGDKCKLIGTNVK